MKFYAKNLLKSNILIYLNLQRRDKSTKTIEKSVVISKSHDIYTNLALEGWFYKNWDFDNKHLLMLWSNKPCVVIGKFQNPWLECNVPELNTILPDGIHLARRSSGGGTVYHDLGNLNLTFFTSNDDYNRSHNLEIITRAVLHRFGLKLEISDRLDLVYGNYKVSGTASYLARKYAYHHCTLLVNSDKEILTKSLKKPDYFIETKASQSIRSPIINLTDLNDKITVSELIKSISKEYLKTIPYVKGKKQVNLISNHLIKNTTPTEDEYRGILDIRDEFKSSDWIFGKCPDFTARKTIILNNTEVDVNMQVEKGLVFDLNLTEKNNNLNLNRNFYLELFKDRKFNENLFKEVENVLKMELFESFVSKI